ncbi:hypothetical protein QQZ08_002397 [Neonectria magnoliae]|uniref:Uncharacterized protein n=1 Tax=Neonectria magnoliae TaxID=2732573 RepID=A0ABR1IE71_9HYPO
MDEVAKIVRELGGRLKAVEEERRGDPNEVNRLNARAINDLKADKANTDAKTDAKTDARLTKLKQAGSSDAITHKVFAKVSKDLIPKVQTMIRDGGVGGTNEKGTSAETPTKAARTKQPPPAGALALKFPGVPKRAATESPLGTTAKKAKQQQTAAAVNSKTKAKAGSTMDDPIDFGCDFN